MSQEVISELDFSKLPPGSDFAQSVILNLRIGGQEIRVTLSDRGLYAGMQEWLAAHPMPVKKSKIVTVMPTDELGQKMRAAGYKGPWPAIREVIDAKDDEHEKASEEWVKECSWHAVGLAFPAFRDDSGRLLEDPSERVSFLKSKRMLDRHAVALGQELMNLQAVTVEKADGDAADFFGGA